MNYVVSGSCFFRLSLKTDCGIGFVTLLLTEAAASFCNQAPLQPSLAKFGDKIVMRA